MPQEHLGAPRLEFARTRELVGFNDAARGCHQERPRKICCSFGQDARRIGDGDAEFCCRVDGNVIESNSKISDNLQSWRGLEQFQIDGIRKKGKRSVLVAEMCGQLLFRQDRKSTRLNSSHGYISYAV